MNRKPRKNHVYLTKEEAECYRHCLESRHFSISKISRLITDESQSPNYRKDKLERALKGTVSLSLKERKRLDEISRCEILTHEEYLNLFKLKLKLNKVTQIMYDVLRILTGE